MSFMSLEPWLRSARTRRILPHLPLGGVLVDIGCNTPPITIQAVKNRMKYCVGIDAEVENKSLENYELKKCFIKKKLPVKSGYADVITMLAVLEHMEYPEDVARECARILKPGGVLLVTVPSPKNKKLLEFLASLGIVSKVMIDQHKNYFTPKRLISIFKQAGFSKVNVNLFQYGYNTFVKAIK